jgi:SP family sugar:H+ symporter-like MFS transporter
MLVGAVFECGCALIAGLVGHFTSAPKGTATADLTDVNKKGGSVLVAFGQLHRSRALVHAGRAPC